MRDKDISQVRIFKEQHALKCENLIYKNDVEIDKNISTVYVKRKALNKFRN